MSTPPREQHHRPRGIVFIWPPAPTVIEPSKLATVTTAIITALLQLRDAKRVCELSGAEPVPGVGRPGRYRPWCVGAD
jgi:hypothetical protein